MIQKEIAESVTGAKFRHLNLIFLLISSLLCVLIFLFTIAIKSKFNYIISGMDDYSSCTKALDEFRMASDVLTNQARLFVEKKQPVFLESYFYELNTLQRREHSLEIIELTHTDDAIDASMKMAMTESNYLAKIELYALRLVCDALETDFSAYLEPGDVVQVSKEDDALEPEQKIERARSLVFDAEYLTFKDLLTKYCSDAQIALVNGYISLQNESYDSVSRRFNLVVFLIILLVIVCAVLFVLLMLLILNPLEKQVESIESGTKMQSRGSYEIKYIAEVYNELCEKNSITASVLKHKAEHDPLTGLINREAFEQIKDVLAGSTEAIAYLIVDIDFFKRINDEFGHLIGDEVLKKIAGLLMEQFRATDYVARIGGDEFAIIMTKFGTSAKDIIQRKIDGLNRRLQVFDDGLPTVSLSVGVAFSESGYVPELVERSDKALYRVKRGGRCNCSFYEAGGK